MKSLLEYLLSFALAIALLATLYNILGAQLTTTISNTFSTLPH